MGYLEQNSRKLARFSLPPNLTDLSITLHFVVLAFSSVSVHLFQFIMKVPYSSLMQSSTTNSLCFGASILSDVGRAYHIRQNLPNFIDF